MKSFRNYRVRSTMDKKISEDLSKGNGNIPDYQVEIAIFLIFIQ
jgi:hypothetical protein